MMKIESDPNFRRELEERLVRYASIDSQSDEASASCPSTERQFDMLRLLERELREIGASDVRITEYAAVLASIPATVATPVPTIAFLAHVDTAPQFNATGVKPIVHRAYDGGEIVLPEAPDVRLSPDRFAYLGQKIGDDAACSPVERSPRWSCWLRAGAPARRPGPSRPRPPPSRAGARRIT